MSTPQSDQEYLCPKCGAVLDVGADHCGKCRYEFRQTGAAAGVGGSRGLPPFQGRMHQPSPAWVVLKTLGILAIIVVASSGAFFATCFGGFIAGDAMARHAGGDGRSGLDQSIITGIIAGGVAAVAVIGGSIWLFWLHPRKNAAHDYRATGSWK